ncbi:MAG: hypothetical protein AAF938_08705 [Myxococcota bacterium]
MKTLSIFILTLVASACSPHTTNAEAEMHSGDEADGPAEGLNPGSAFGTCPESRVCPNGEGCVLVEDCPECHGGSMRCRL